MTRAGRVFAAAVLLAGCSHPAPTREFTSQRPARPSALITPGALNPQVTQETIGMTICVPNWTAKIRPPASYTTSLKRKQIKQYGYSDVKLADYELDHLIPLSSGGAPRDPRNLWPQPIAQAKVKDRDEGRLHDAICSGKLTLAAAQAEILRLWGPS